MTHRDTGYNNRIEERSMPGDFREAATDAPRSRAAEDLITELCGQRNGQRSSKFNLTF